MNVLIPKFDTDSKSFFINFFLFPLSLQMYRLTMANVPPVVHVPQVGNPSRNLKFLIGHMAWSSKLCEMLMLKFQTFSSFPEADQDQIELFFLWWSSLSN